MRRSWLEGTMVGGLLALGVLALASGAVAQPQPGGGRDLSPQARTALDRERQAIESQARRTVDSLFQRLCPGRCQLVELQAEMKSPETVGGVEPGFGSGSNASFDIEAKSLNLTVLIDSKLPSNFQQNIPRMLEYQLGDLAPKIEVRRETLSFPEPQNRPSPPSQDRQRRPRPRPKPKMPQAQPERREKPKEDEEPAKEEPDKKETDRREAASARAWFGMVLEEVAPWLGPILLVVVLLALMFPLLRRLGDLLDRRAMGVAPTGAGQGADGPRPDVEALRARLTESRAVKNRVLRRWLEEDVESVAGLVRLLGPGILDDLKTDESLQTRLEEVSEIVARNREPMDDDEIEWIVNAARARISAAQLMHERQGLESDWDFLEGISVATLQRILRACGTEEQVHVIGQLPSSLRSSYLESLDGDQRKQLFMAAGTSELSKQQSRALAARLRKRADEYGHVGAEAEGQAALVVDMLESLPLDEQEETLRDLEQTRPEVAEAVMSEVLLASAAVHVPGELLAGAVHRTPVDELANFLRRSGDEIRRRILEVAPEKKREDLQTELALDTPVPRDEFLEARDRFLDGLETALRREGRDLVEANRRALHGDSTSTSTRSEARR